MFFLLLSPTFPVVCFGSLSVMSELGFRSRLVSGGHPHFCTFCSTFFPFSLPCYVVMWENVAFLLVLSLEFKEIERNWHYPFFFIAHLTTISCCQNFLKILFIYFQYFCWSQNAFWLTCFYLDYFWWRSNILCQEVYPLVKEQHLKLHKRGQTQFRTHSLLWHLRLLTTSHHRSPFVTFFIHAYKI